MELHRFASWLVPMRKMQAMVRSFELGLRPGRKLSYFRHLTHAHLPRGGHHLHMTEPDLVADAIKAWASRCDESNSWRMLCRRAKFAMNVSMRWVLVLGICALWRYARS